jgi:hypothetical protein
MRMLTVDGEEANAANALATRHEHRRVDFTQPSVFGPGFKEDGTSGAFFHRAKKSWHGFWL